MFLTKNTPANDLIVEEGHCTVNFSGGPPESACPTVSTFLQDWVLISDLSSPYSIQELGKNIMHLTSLRYSTERRSVMIYNSSDIRMNFPCPSPLHRHHHLLPLLQLKHLLLLLLQQLRQQLLYLLLHLRHLHLRKLLNLLGKEEGRSGRTQILPLAW